jgi:hypothetical protein
MQSPEFGLIRRKAVVHGGFASDSELRSARRAGIIAPVVRGVSAPADGVALSRDDEYRRRVIAVAGRSSVRVVSHQSAAVCHGMQLFQPDQRLVHMIARTKGKREGDVHVHHALLDDADVVVINGIRVTSRAVTACDVARAGTVEQAVAALDDALRSGVPLGDLHAITARTPHATGIGTLRRALLLADGEAESVGESVSRALMAGWNDIPRPTLQTEFFDADGLIGRTDFDWDGKVVGEFDGRVKYLGTLQSGEKPEDAVYREKLREDRLRALGIVVVRWSWDDLLSPVRLRAKLRAALIRGGVIAR